MNDRFTRMNYHTSTMPHRTRLSLATLAGFRNRFSAEHARHQIAGAACDYLARWDYNPFRPVRAQIGSDRGSNTGSDRTPPTSAARCPTMILGSSVHFVGLDIAHSNPQMRKARSWDKPEKATQ